MPKRFIDAASFALGCLVLLIWQLGVPAYAQAQTQSAPDPKGTMDRGPERERPRPNPIWLLRKS
jgi:hypothetical protein